MIQLLIKAAVLLLLVNWFPGLEAAEAKPLSIDVPEKYRDAKFRISGEVIQPKEGKITIESYDQKRKRIETLDSNHRILNDSYNRLNKSSLAESRRRYVRFGPTVGLVQVENAVARKLSIEASMTQFGGDVLFQPGKYGLVAGVSRIQGSCQRQSGLSGVCGEFVSDVFRFGISSEFMPFQKGALFFQRVHVGFNLGVNHSKHKITFGDGDFKVKDKSLSYGGFSNFELRHAFGMNFWWFARLGYAYQRLKFEELYFNEDFHQYQFSVGVRYAL